MQITSVMVVIAIMGTPLAYSQLQDPPQLVLEATGIHTPLDHTLLAHPVIPGVPFKSVHNAPAHLSVGDTTITWVISYDDGGRDIYRQVVKVQDTTPPEFVTDVQPVKKYSKSGNPVRVHFEMPGARDLADIDVTVTSSPESGSKFPLGNTTVAFTAVDDSGNRAVTYATVTVADWGIQNLEASRTHDRIHIVWDQLRDHATYRVQIAEAGSDDPVQDVRVSLTSHTFTGLMPATDYTVTVGASGDRTTFTTRNVATLAIDTRTADTIPPIITAPKDITVEATGPLTPVFPGFANATDDTDPSPTISNNAPELFPVGRTIVTWTAEDSSGNMSMDEHTVVVQDTTPPRFGESPLDSFEYFVSPAGASRDYPLPIVFDNVDETPIVTGKPPSGSWFYPGFNMINFTATDSSGNTASVSWPFYISNYGRPSSIPNVSMEHTETITVPVYDYRNPAFQNTYELIRSPDFASIADQYGGALITLDPDESDVGLHTITAKWENKLWYRTGTPSFDVTVLPANQTRGGSQQIAAPPEPIAPPDDAHTLPPEPSPSAPVITPPPDITVTTSGSHATVQLGDATVIDDNDSSLPILNDAPATFPVGITMVTWTTIDSDGNTATAYQTVTVLPADQ